MELQAKSNFEKETKKINAKFQEERKKTSYLKMMLAKSNPEFPGASRMLHLQDTSFNQMWLQQLPRQQNATCHSLDSNPSSRGRAATTSQNSYASAGSRTMVLSPALQTSYNTSETFRDLSARLPISSSSRNLQAGGEASHIPPYGPSTFIPASGVSGILHGMPSYHPSTPSSHINSISSFSRNLQAGVEIRTPAPHLYLPSTFIPMLPPTTISKVGTQRWHGQENIGLSPHAHTLSFKDMHMNPN
ncbi:hypothetical protein QL285_057907 [Trifolium repens]|nr:hypothetical protein QL285_057907 [Trifolium repens]